MKFTKRREAHHDSGQSIWRVCADRQPIGLYICKDTGHRRGWGHSPEYDLFDDEETLLASGTVGELMHLIERIHALTK